MLECVVNVSEGRRPEVIEALGRAGGAALLDVHIDPDHNRAVLTLVGEEAPRAVARVAVELIDISGHRGAHPRIGAVDVVPFVPLGAASMADAIGARDRFATWAAASLGLPCFLYGPERSLPDLRRAVSAGAPPDLGPAHHPTAGAVAVGARPPMVAHNIWLADPDLQLARRLARDLRQPDVRTLGLAVGQHVQVSANLIRPLVFGPADLYDGVAARTTVARAELVGLLPRSVLERVPARRWPSLDLADDATIEARVERAGLTWDSEVL